MNGDLPVPSLVKRTRWLLVCAAFTLFFFLTLWPLFSRRCEPRWDAVDEFYPAFTYLADAYREGRFPLWDPYTNCGYPFHAEPHQPTLNPLALVLAFLVPDTGLGFLLYWTLQLKSRSSSAISRCIRKASKGLR